MKHVFTGTKKKNPSPDQLEIYMHPMEYGQLMAILWTLRPRRILEWGAGGSTQALLSDCPFIERYVSIEHHRPWFENVRRLVRDDRLEMHCVEPTVPPPEFARDKKSRQRVKEWVHLCETDRSVLAEYVDLPLGLDPPFDLVLVDGRARVFCVERGHELLRPGGVLVLHDAQREVYHPALHKVGEPVFLEPFGQGQICMVPKPEEVG